MSCLYSATALCVFFLCFSGGRGQAASGGGPPPVPPPPPPPPPAPLAASAPVAAPSNTTLYLVIAGAAIVVLLVLCVAGAGIAYFVSEGAGGAFRGGIPQAAMIARYRSPVVGESPSAVRDLVHNGAPPVPVREYVNEAVV
jgi:hypothetical protein